LVIVSSGEWEGEGVDLFSQLLRPGDHVLDIGAYIGTFSVVFAALVGITGRVHAFEPQKYLSGLIHTSISLGSEHWQIVSVHNAAVGEVSGEVELPLLDYHSGETSWVDVHFRDGTGKGIQSEYNEVSSMKVPQVSLDSLHLECPALMKLDVEGMELGVLAGAKELFARCAMLPILYLVRLTMSRIPPYYPLPTLCSPPYCLYHIGEQSRAVSAKRGINGNH
jgi:FkbM family methyltransferase